MNIDIPQSTTGITVFGSSIIRVSPDTATVSAAVSRTEKDPKTAFDAARTAGAAVQRLLKNGQFGDFGSLRINLSQEFRYVQSENRFIGYKARIGYTITLRDLDRTEDLLVGLVSAGANELQSVSFETTRLKELRADARTQAIAAAREKAELYCRAAGVVIGKVTAIVDTNPDLLRGTRESHITGGGGVSSNATDPALITIGASVYMIFEIAGVSL